MKFFQGSSLASLCVRCLLVLYVAVSHSEAVRELQDRFYLVLNDSLPCFRLTNADGQIGCSGSFTNTRGVIHYVADQSDVEWLIHRSSHPPYIALMEPSVFTSLNVPRLKDSGRVNGIILRYNNDESPPDFFSAERECPNKGFGVDGECSDDQPWNNYNNGTSLSFSDFGDFPIFAVPNHTYDAVLSCFNSDNADSSGSIADYPLCAAEMVADMLNAVNTETCYRRGNLLNFLVNDWVLCDPLGDKTVWGSIFELNETRISNGSIMLATKLDSVAFFPYLAWGANNELAGVATLMSVLQTIGNLKKSKQLLGTYRPILYSFFHGESWDYIGSSRMIYDMEKGDFPSDFGPKFSHDDITDYLELTNLGLFDSEQPTVYYHNITASPLLDAMVSIASGTFVQIALQNSSRTDLPVASLQRFLRRNPAFSGAVLSDFDDSFTSKFYGSRYDNKDIFLQNGNNLPLVADQLAHLASLITQAVVDTAGPMWNDSNPAPIYTEADPGTIEDILLCFLNSSDCDLFRSVLTYDKAQELEDRPLQRYISVDTTTNSETIITHALAASFTGERVSPSGSPDTPVPCSECSDISDDDQVTVVKQQSMVDQDTCYCVLSYVHYHTAVSPAFIEGEEDYSSHTYSTWTESRWQYISLRIYLVTYPLQEVAFLLGGLAMTLITLLLALRVSRQSSRIFKVLPVMHTPLRLTMADRLAQPEPINTSDLDLQSDGD